MNRRRKWILSILGLGLAVLVCEQLWRHGRAYVLPMQFATLEDGKIYRGAWQQNWPMRKIVRDYKIKTIVALAHPSDHPMAVQERALAKELGINWVHIPIVDDRTLAYGMSMNELLEKAAAILHDPACQPVYFHCHHGLNRASMVQIAYRTRFCGWTLEQANAEINRQFGLIRATHGPDYRYMARYYQERILPLRESEKKAPERSDQSPVEQTARSPNPNQSPEQSRRDGSDVNSKARAPRLHFTSWNRRRIQPQPNRPGPNRFRRRRC